MVADLEASAASPVALHPTLIRGYPSFATHISEHPEHCVFRRFDALSAQNALYLQAELICLETRLRKIEATAAQSKSPQPDWRYAKDWEYLNASEYLEGEHKDTQLQLVLRIRDVLKEYEETLLRKAAVSLLPAPEKHDLQYVRDWLESPRDGEGNFPFTGADRRVWNDATDLCAIRQRPAPDYISKWMVNTVIPWWHRLVGQHARRLWKKKSTRGTTVYDDSRVLQGASIIATVLASLLIVAPVAILNKIQSVNIQITVMAISTVVFSLTLTLTNARRSDIFAFTAGFAAVQVVFIGVHGSSMTSPP